jgi:hypothetical protein
MNYYDVPRISNSGLSCIDPETGGHPEKYLDFMNGRYRIASTSLSLGDIIHRHLLLGEIFVSLDKKPGDVVISILNEYHSRLVSQERTGICIDSDRELLLSLIRSKGYYNNRKDETVLDGIIKEGAEYFDVIVQNGGRGVISSEWQEILNKLTIASLHKPIESIVNPAKCKGVEVVSEVEIYFDIVSSSWDGGLTTFKCKAKIDRLVVDHNAGTYRIVDLKSTSGQLESFPDSVLKYKYNRQLAFYAEAVKSILPRHYMNEGNFILALETTGYCRARLFKLDAEILEEGERNYRELLKRINYHTETQNWLYPLEEEENCGVYPLSSPYQ